MAYLHVAIRATEYGGQPYAVGDIYPQAFTQPAQSFPLNDASVWKALEMPAGKDTVLLSALLNVQALDGNGDPVWVQGFTIDVNGKYPGQQGYVETQGDVFIVDANEVNPGGVGYIQTRDPVMEDRLDVDASKIAARVAGLKVSAIGAIAHDFDVHFEALIQKVYPGYERLTFDELANAAVQWDAMTEAEQDTEITAFIADRALYGEDSLILFRVVESEQGVALTADVTGRGLVDDYVTIVRSKSKQFRDAVGTLIGDRRRMEAEVAAFADVEASVNSLNSYTFAWSV